MDIAERYASALTWIYRYDEGLLSEPETATGGRLPGITEVRDAVDHLKTELIGRNEASELFARERDSGLEALLGNLNQSVLGEPAYPSLESKAAHLLYFVVKDHPFVDGNKRCAAYLFVDFLHRNGCLFNDRGEPVVNNVGLAALTLLVAECDPADKGTMVRLIINMLARSPAA